MIRLRRTKPDSIPSPTESKDAETKTCSEDEVSLVHAMYVYICSHWLKAFPE